MCVCRPASKYSETEHRLLEARGVFFLASQSNLGIPQIVSHHPPFSCHHHRHPFSPHFASFSQDFLAGGGNKLRVIKFEVTFPNYDMKSVLNSLASNDSASIEGDFEDLGRLGAPLLRRSRRSPLSSLGGAPPSPPLLLQLTS